MELDCSACGKRFAARSSRARFCSDKCRARARYRRAVLGISDDQPAKAEAKRKRRKASDLEQGITPAVIRELEAAGRADTSAGRTAIALARRIDDGAESSAGMAALTRELSARMAEATVSAESEGDAIDELRARREARRAV